MAKIDTISTDTTTQVADSIRQSEVAAVEKKGIVMMRPVKGVEPIARYDSPAVNSWLLGSICLIFCLVCIRYKNNSKYLKNLFFDLVDTNARANHYDDTIRENSFLVLTNILNAVSMGMLVYELVGWINADYSTIHKAVAAMISIGVYYCVMPLAYLIVGFIFTDDMKAKVWAKGFFTTGAILAVPLFFTSMIGLFYPGATGVMLCVAALIYVLVKIMFMRKGLMLFYTSPVSWILMLYYIIGMEAVPLILVAASIMVY